MLKEIFDEIVTLCGFAGKLFRSDALDNIRLLLVRVLDEKSWNAVNVELINQLFALITVNPAEND